MTAAFFIGLPVLASLTGIVKPSPTAATATATATTPSEKVASTTAPATTAALDSSSAKSEPTIAPPAASNWTYDESTDTMRDTTTKFASTTSEESFPNSMGMSDSTTRMAVQKRGQKYEISLNNPNLQFTCSSFTSTRVAVKFDSGPIGKYECTESVGHKYGVMFIESENRFLAKMRQSKKVIIEAEVFQRGNVQMTFDVGGLDI